MTIVSLIIVAMTITFEANKGHMALCFVDNNSERSCIDCSSSKEDYAVCERYYTGSMGFDLREYEPITMGWTNGNITTTAKELTTGKFTDDDRKAVKEIWISDCQETGEDKLCWLANYASRNF
jgi:hypothetical protein